jgi:hypothetical protein
MFSELGENLDLNWRFYCVWLKKFFMLTLIMSGFRYISFESLGAQSLLTKISNEQIFDMFVLGFRFDAMISAFLMIPVLFLILLRLSLAERLPIYHMVFYSRRFVAILWCLSALIFAVDFHFLETQHRHMRFDDWQQLTHLHQLTLFVNLDYDKDFFFSVISLLGLTYLGFCLLLDESEFYIDKSSVWRTWGRSFELGVKFFLPFVVTAMVARGSLGSHHLGARHAAALSSNKSLNELAVNPLWTFSKVLDGPLL